MRFTIIIAALVAAVAAAPSQDLEERAAVSSDCSPTGAKAGSVTCNDPAYTYESPQDPTHRMTILGQHADFLLCDAVATISS